MSVGPNRNPNLTVSVKKALEDLKEFVRDKDVLIQTWLPRLPTDEDSMEFIGLPGPVFLNKLPEWTPDVCFLKDEEYSRIKYSQRIMLEDHLLFQEDCSESYQAALAEIKDILKCACNTHKLPLAKTWTPRIQQGKSCCRHSNENYANCVSKIDSASYVADPLVSGFLEACSEHHLLKGEDVVGKASITNQPCFSEDITAFSKTEYPLSHHARVLAAVAILLRSIYTGNADFVLEFFLPLNCKNALDQKKTLDSLSSVIHYRL
ncbi:Hypothetical predicted protein [Olea europaea subsp. europaea]|uniref:NLP1-9 GAF domain-containing protein n=1 Tax=Olea europaea subsp. europaea TaxID=158383 RepID=A0A8S0SB02_OLEEU|nr:Hypothetical predicted protein [Olea europaea subsp. europaea]